MTTVNMHTAEAELSRLVEQVETGAESEIIISRNGHPAARIVPVERLPRADRPLGLAAGQYETCSQDEFDENNPLIAEMFGGEI